MTSKIGIALVVAALVSAGLYSGVRYVVSHRPPRSEIGSAAPSYAVTDLGPGMASGMNNWGLVVGMHIAGTYPGGFPYFHGFLWQHGVVTDIGTLGGIYSSADSVNNGGQILGTANVPGHALDDSSVRHLCLWQNGRLSDISRSGTDRFTSAASNPLGQVYLTGYDPASKAYRLFLRENGTVRDLGPLGHTIITVHAVNRQGQVVGTLGKWASKTSRAFLWDKRGLRDLGVPPGFGSSEAVGINDRGQIIGDASKYGEESPSTRAFLWQSGKFRDLGTLGGNFALPHAINNAGQVVGTSNISFPKNAGRFHAFLWRQGRMQDMTALIPRNTPWLTMDAGTGINDRGQIVGTGRIVGDDLSHSYLLTPMQTKETRKT